MPHLRMPAPAYHFASFSLLPAQRKLLRDGETVALGARATDLLITLVQRHGEVISKDALIAAVWPGVVVEENNLRVQLAAVRKALGEPDSDTRYIVNVPLRGYSFVGDVDVDHAKGEEDPHPPGPTAQVSRRPALPVALTRLIGREEVIANLASHLQERRLVTLTGPGGVGKTSVAVSVATAMPALRDGIAFVDLSTVTEGPRVAVALAVALGVPVHASSATASIDAWLVDKQMLVLLDNCEHVIDAAASLAEAVLRSAPGVVVLTTSREPLRIAGEWVHRLAALAVPSSEASLSLSEACASPAVELFIERALASQDCLQFTDNDVPHIIELCRRLDGLPLAIELIAARIESFGLAGLVARFEDRLRLLGQGRRTALPRHQTLRAALDWSYNTLPQDEQLLLKRLSVFRERFDAAATAVVACDSTDRFAAEDALDNLVSKSLLSVNPRDVDAPYRLLETTRGYAAEKLADDEPVRRATMAQHAAWCLQELEAAEPQFQSLGPSDWHGRHARRVDDVRSALAWAFDGGDRMLGLRLTAAAVSLWLHLGLVREAAQQLQIAMQHLPLAAAEPTLAAQLLVASAHCVVIHDGPSPQVDQWLTEGQALLDVDAPLRLRLLLHWTRFISDIVRGDYEQALAHSLSFGADASGAKDEDGSFAAHRMQALALHLLGRQRDARVHVEQALNPASRIARGVLRGNPQQSDHETTALAHRARILWMQGYPDQARALADDAYRHAAERGHTRPLVYALSYAACPVALWTGDEATASRYIEVLSDSTERFGLVFWKQWQRLYAHALKRRGTVHWTREGPDGHLSNMAHADMLSTLDVGFVVANLESVRARARSVWCGPEMLRMAALAEQPRAETLKLEVDDLLREAIAIGEAQDAPAWSLRAAISLSRLLLAEDRRGEARWILEKQYERFTEGLGTPDLLAAQVILRDCT